MEWFRQAVSAIAADDRATLARLLEAHPELVKQTTGEEAFIAAIVHQIYAGDTLLHVAAAAFRAGIVADLLARGAELSARNRRGAQALHYACDANHRDPEAQAATITVLLNAGADANALDKSSVAPLHRAVRTRSSAAVKTLLDGGANPNLRNGKGSTPLNLAGWTTGRGGTGSPEAKAEQAQIVEMLRARGAA